MEENDVIKMLEECVYGRYSLEEVVEFAHQEHMGNFSPEYKDFLDHLEECEFCSIMLRGIKVVVKEFKRDLGLPEEELS